MSARFTSFLATEFEEFLDYKRALGHPYERGEWTLLSFDRFVQGAAPTRALPVLSELVAGWLASRQHRKPVSVANELGVIRQFCLFRRRRHANSFVPGREWAPQSTQSSFLPYIFSTAEIRNLLEQALKVRRPAFRGCTLRLLLLLMYCTGLRPGEAVRLRVSDVDLQRSLLVIRRSKGRTRLVPFERDLARELRNYLHQREQHVASPEVESLCLRPDGHPLSTANLSGLFRGLVRRMGLKPSHGRIGPRPYDLRHAFAVHRLTRWHQAGLDVHAQLPWLSAYMGHVDIHGTEDYLRATPELLALAGHRFERLVRGPARR